MGKKVARWYVSQESTIFIQKSSEVWKELNKHLKNYYLKHFFYNIDGPNIGYRMLELHEM